MSKERKVLKGRKIMNGFIDKLQQVLIPFSQKINNSKVLKGIMGGFSAMLPIVMAGSIFTLLSSLNIAPYQALITNIGLKPILAVVADYTTNMISIYAVFLIAFAEAGAIGMKDTKDQLSAGIIALMVFLLLCPLGVAGTDKDSGVTVRIAAALATNYLGSAGLFSAMILGIVIPNLHNIFIKHNITIKMPDTVPPMISKSFAAMIPALALAALALVVRQLCALTPFGSFTMLIYGLLKAPLASLAASPVTFILLLFICNFLWFFGIHGGMVATAIMNALYTNLTLENLAAYGAGQPLPNPIISSAWFTIGNIAGSGCGIGLCMCLIFFAKSDRFKALAKIAGPAGICGITEPMVFGVPMVLNPLMLIPMLIAPAVTLLIGYFSMISGLVPFMNGVAVNTGTPILLSAFVAWGSWKGIVLQAILICVSTAIYFPFFKALDNQALKDEAEAANK